MDLFLIFMIIISLIGIEVYYKKFNKNYLSMTSTNCVKGIFILFVFFSHAMQYITVDHWYDSTILYLRNNLNQLIVVLFLFYSGYGIYESFKRKKVKYINQFPKNRILKTLFHFDVAILCFVILNLFLNNEMSVKQVLLSLIGWDSVGNSNWYIFDILILYLITYVSLKSFSGKKALLCVWIQTIIFALLLSLYKNDWWYNTLFCFPLGMTYSYFKTQIESNVQKNNFSYFVCLITTFLATFVFTYLSKNNFWYYELWAIVFTLLIVLCTMKIKLKSPILNWLGQQLFLIYILQRIPMIIGQYYGYNVTHPYRYFAICFIITILLTYIFNIIFNKIDLKLFKKTKSRT